MKIPAIWQQEIDAGTEFGKRAKAAIENVTRADSTPIRRNRGNHDARPCTGCNKSVHRPSMLTRAVSAFDALRKFIGDGMQTTTPDEAESRRAICAECPLNNNGTCDGCGCILSVKIHARLEQCPAKKWHPEIHPVRPIADPIRNLIMHIMPVESNDNWKWNLEQIAKRIDLFNGKRVLAIAEESNAVRGSQSLRTVSADAVLKYSRSVGIDWMHVRTFTNDSKLREVVSFPWLLETVQSGNPNEVTFACHAKGVTHSSDSITVKWAERQYRVCLDDWFTVHRTLERYSMAGAFRKFGQFRTQGNHQWHYSGTNYWFRHDDVFAPGKDWRCVDRMFFGTESWPGRMFAPEHCACLFGDDTGDLYKDIAWHHLQREIEVWEGARHAVL